MQIIDTHLKFKSLTKRKAQMEELYFIMLHVTVV